MNTTTATKKANRTAETIASRLLNLDTLEEQRADDLDFHDLHVSQIRAALVAAYEAGKAAKA